MTIETEHLLESILSSIERIDYIKPDSLPNIDLYMDQITTFMDAQLQSTKRHSDDKILTKTMINNYAKNNLLPPPLKKKYTKEHILLLIFIYYFKSILSINDIQNLLAPITEKYFDTSGFSLESIYNEVFSLEKTQIDYLKEDVIAKYNISFSKAFDDAQDKDKDFLRLFSFICMLSFDVYVKKMLIETLIDQLPSPTRSKDNKKSEKDK